MLRFVLGMDDDDQSDAVSDGDELRKIHPGSQKGHRSYLFRGSPQVPDGSKVKVGFGLSE
jgi:hypothetical protein